MAAGVRVIEKGHEYLLMFGKNNGMMRNGQNIEREIATTVPVTSKNFWSLENIRKKSS